MTICWAPGYKPIKEGPRCARCHRRWRKPAYGDYCSYSCEQWAALDRARAHLDKLKELT